MNVTDRDWIQTYSGRQFWPLTPKAEDLWIVDIAHALSHQCRFTGHVREFYSVAQHSCLVHDLLVGSPCDIRFCALMHDASEAYLVDLAKPLKNRLHAYEAAEEYLMSVIAKHYGFPWPMPDVVKQADIILLFTERRDLMAAPPRPWTGHAEPMEARIVPWTPSLARSEFIKRFARYMNEIPN
jgi:hypothetical protein